MFIVHVHCSLFMFIVHCSHGATLIFDVLFLRINTFRLLLSGPMFSHSAWSSRPLVLNSMPPQVMTAAVSM